MMELPPLPPKPPHILRWVFSVRCLTGLLANAVALSINAWLAWADATAGRTGWLVVNCLGMTVSLYCLVQWARAVYDMCVAHRNLMRAWNILHTIHEGFRRDL